MAVHGKDAVFKLDTSGDVLTDISSNIISVDMPDSIDEAETTTLGSDSKTFIQGTSGATITLEMIWDATIDAHIYGIKRITGDFEYSPAGTAGGSPKYTGSCFPTSIGTPVTVGDAVKFSVTLRVTGDITRGTH